MRPVRFTVQNAVGEVLPALHPDKHLALREILGKETAKAQKKARRPKSPAAQPDKKAGVALLREAAFAGRRRA